jgi:DNA polymerase-1
MRTALLDADIICWKACSLAQQKFDLGGEEVIKANEGMMRNIANNMVRRWSEMVNADQTVFCVSDRADGGRSFRFDIATYYHENRLKMVRPEGLLQLHWDMVKKYKGVFHPGLEGDDILGILGTSGEFEDPVIVTEDKDMWSVPCSVFLPTRSKVIRRVPEETANRYWFRQALIGDPADNYKGCTGVGKVRAKTLLAGAQSVKELWTRTLGAFLRAGHTEAYALEQLRLARILRAEDINDDWTEIKLWHPSTPKILTLPKPHQVPLSASELRLY